MPRRSAHARAPFTTGSELRAFARLLDEQPPEKAKPKADARPSPDVGVTCVVTALKAFMEELKEHPPKTEVMSHA